MSFVYFECHVSIHLDLFYQVFFFLNVVVFYLEEISILISGEKKEKGRKAGSHAGCHLADKGGQ